MHISMQRESSHLSNRCTGLMSTDLMSKRLILCCCSSFSTSSIYANRVLCCRYCNTHSTVTVTEHRGQDIAVKHSHSQVYMVGRTLQSHRVTAKCFGQDTAVTQSHNQLFWAGHCSHAQSQPSVYGGQDTAVTHHIINCTL